VAALLASLETNLPRIFVERFLGARELGFFAASGYLVIVGARFVTSLCEATLPRLAAYRASGDRGAFVHLLMRTVGVVAAISLTALATAWALGDAVLAALYQPEYAAHAQVLVVLMLAAALEYVATCLKYAMTAARVLRPQPYIVAAASAVTALACLALVPREGSIGAAAAMCAGAAVHLVANALVLRAGITPPRAA
jgi:O-antigen/teichoic acid export membrane protein